MESFNVISIVAATRAILPLKESPVKVMSYTLVASSDLDKVLDMTKEVNRRVSAPSMKMDGRTTNIDSRRAMSFGRLAPLDVGHPTHTCEASPSAHGHGPRSGSALSPHPTIGREH
jgi:hypothetical protein